MPPALTTLFSRIREKEALEEAGSSACSGPASWKSFQVSGPSIQDREICARLPNGSSRAITERKNPK